MDPDSKFHQTEKGSSNTDFDDTMSSVQAQPDNSSQLPMHSTPLPASEKNKTSSGAYAFAVSPIEGRRSGRERKKTLKGEQLDEILKNSKGNITADDSDVQADSETQAEAFTARTLSEESMGQFTPTRGRKGRPRRMVVVSNPVQTSGESSALLKEETTAPKRKRGRPRKVEYFVEDEPDPSRPGEDQFMTCETCGEEVRAAWFKSHEREHHGKHDEEKEEGDARRPDKPTMGRRRQSRKAAIVCRQAIELTEEEMSEAESPIKSGKKRGPKKKNSKPKVISDQSAHNESELETIIEKCLRCGEPMEGLSAYKHHLQTKHAAVYSKAFPEGEQTPQAWLEIIKTMKKIHCPDCGKPFNFLHYFKYHLKWCGRESETTLCVLCNREIKSMWMAQHEQGHRNREAQQKEAATHPQDGKRAGGRKRKAATAALKTFASASDEKDDEGEEKGRKSRTRHRDKDWASGGEDDIDDEMVDDNTGGEDVEKTVRVRTNKPTEGEFADGRKISFPRVVAMDYFLQQENFMDQQPSQHLHTTLLPRRCDWVPLSESEANPHFPATRKSVQFSVEGCYRYSNTQPARLGWGETHCSDGQATAFAGGPVKAMEWCPLEESVVRGQVLAVAAGRVMWKEHRVFQRAEGPGLIQFWSAGTLDARPSRSPALKLAFTVAHNSGHVISLSWCPRGAYSKLTPGGGEFFQRLGLLAVGGSDSNILIYSVPTPESLLGDHGTAATSSKTTSPPAFKPPPALTLTCPNAEAVGRCTSVSWQKGGDCDLVAGGYARGFVHLWHVSSTSPFVRQSANTLAPIRTFFAHGVAVFSIDWSWSDPAHFATGGMDSLIKMWDAEDTRAPFFAFPEQRKEMRGPIRKVAFCSAALDGLITCDDQRDQYSGMVCGVDLSTGPPLGLAGMRTQVTLNRHAATIWDLSYSAWYNVVVSCDNTGLLSLASCWPIHNIGAKGLVKARKGLPIFTTSCTMNGADSEDSQNNASALQPVSIDQLHVKFVDYNMKNKKNLVNTGDEQAVTRQTFTGVRVADIFSTSFNPNKASSQWVAAGTKTGFVRILHLPFLSLLFKSAQKFFQEGKQENGDGEKSNREEEKCEEDAKKPDES